MGRPTKEEAAAKKAAANKDITHVDIDKLDEALEQDVVKSIGFGGEEEIIVEDSDVITDPNLINDPNVIEQPHKYEMPPSTNVVDEVVYEDIPNAADDIPENSNPLEEEVKKRIYTNFEKAPVNPNVAPQPEPFIPEPVNIITETSNETIGIEEPKAVKADDAPKQPSAPKKEPINPSLQEQTPKQKREGAEQMANALLLAYGEFAPIPFKKISTHNISKSKIQNLHFKGELDKDMIIDTRTDTTLIEYCEIKTNQVEGIFNITQEMKDDIRPPLIEVLMENGLAMTATQRLMMAVGTQLVGMGFKAFEIMQETKNDMKEFKRMHNEKREDNARMVKAVESINKQEPSRQQQQPPVTQYQTESRIPKKEAVFYEPTTDASEDIPSETSKKVNEYIEKTNTDNYTVEEVPADLD